MAGFDRYYADWRGKIEALNPNHNDGTYILVSCVLSIIDPLFQDESTKFYAGLGILCLNTRGPITQRKQRRPIINHKVSNMSQP